MNKTQRGAVVRALLALLAAAPNGTVTTTGRLLSAAGIEDRAVSEGDLFDIHFDLFTAAEQAGWVLDMSAHEGKQEGLPYNLDFVLRK